MEVEAKQNLNQELQKLKSQLNQSERRNDDGHKQLKALREELAKLRKENEQLKAGKFNSIFRSLLALLGQKI